MFPHIWGRFYEAASLVLYCEIKPDHVKSRSVANVAVDDLFVATGTPEDRIAGKPRWAPGVARDQLQALTKNASTGVPRPNPYHRGAFAAEAVPEAFIETLRVVLATAVSSPEILTRTCKI